MNEQEIENKIFNLRSELKADRLDMSFGELMNIYESEDLIISPEYQRAFRWDDEQKTRFIESVLLGIPIPPIFVAEDGEGKWELVDGLQRVSTILSFFGILKNSNMNNFKLKESSLIKKILKGKDKNGISAKLSLSIKRSVCRVEILRWDSGFDMRYELFNRLNTGGSPLSEQEIRNCVYISEFNKVVNRLSDKLDLIIEGGIKKKEKMYLAELVLRYFAITQKFNNWKIQSNIQLYLNEFMNSMVKKEKENDRGLDVYKKMEEEFVSVVEFVSQLDSPFKGKQQFSASNYDTVMHLAHLHMKDIDINSFKTKIKKILENADYKTYAGHGTSNTNRFVEKLNKAVEIFDNE